MTDAPSLTATNVVDELRSRFPLLGPPLARLYDEWDGDEPGLYIIFPDIVGPYIDVLLSVPASTQRDAALREIFAFVEEMARSGDDYVTGVAADLLDDRFLPAERAVELLDRYLDYLAVETERTGMEPARVGFNGGPALEIIDLHGARISVYAGLGGTVPLTDLPGTTAYDDFTAVDLESVQAPLSDDAVLVIILYSTPYVVCPAEKVAASPETLRELGRQLVARSGEVGDAVAPRVQYWSVPAGERIWRMTDGRAEHGRRTDAVWVHPMFGRDTIIRARQVVLGAREGLE